MDDTQKYDIYIHKRKTLKVVIFFILTLGIYFYFWLWKVIKDINNLEGINQKLNFWTIIVIPLFFDCSFFYYEFSHLNQQTNASLESLYNIIMAIIYIIIARIVIKTIKKYIKQKQNINIRYNYLGLLFFHVFYANYFINTLGKRVSRAVNKEDNELIIL
jgi:ABC-type multidrug transport system fused ATPase/permease subunit